MKLSAPTTITLRRPSADADLIISRHDDAINSYNGSNRTTCDVAERQVSYSDPGSASASSPEDSHSSLLGCSGRKPSEKTKKKKKKRRVEEGWKGGVRRASDCMRDVIKRCQQQFICNERKSKVRAVPSTRIARGARVELELLDFFLKLELHYR